MENYTICNCKKVTYATLKTHFIAKQNSRTWKRLLKMFKKSQSVRPAAADVTINYGHNISNNEQINLKTKEEVFHYEKI